MRGQGVTSKGGTNALSDVRLHTPRGVRDLLPSAARRKGALEQRLASHFSAWGYDPVVTPTFEFMDVFDAAGTAPSAEQLYRLVDREGQVLALRPEMTVPIARLVASRMKEHPAPLRLYYIGSVFRYDEPQSGRLREFTQAGLELIGASGPAADAEVIAVTIEAMMALGLRDFRVDVGHVGFTAGVIDSLGLSVKAATAVRHMLREQDYVGLTGVLEQSGASTEAKETVKALTRLRGGAGVLDEASRLARSEQTERALENVSVVMRHLEDQGVAGWVRIDLGMLKQADYYTGIIVEGYTSEMGYGLCSGGRYDHLLERFGYPAPATGLALGVERLLLALERAGVPNGDEPERIFLVSEPARHREACSTAWRLRRQGYVVEVDVLGMEEDAALAYARRKGMHRTVLFTGAPQGPVELVEGERRRHVAPDDLFENGGRGA